MSLFIRHLYLLLIISLVLTPVQSTFAMQVETFSDATPVATPVATTVTSMKVLTVVLKSNPPILNSVFNSIPKERCSKLGDCNHCQDSASCDSCPMSLGIPQVTSMHSEVQAQIIAVILGAPLYKAEFSPDYRPPRRS